MMRVIAIAAAALAVAGCLSVNVPKVPLLGGDKPADPAPAPAPAPAPQGPYAHLTQRKSFETKASVKLQSGLYQGDFSIGSSSVTVEGAGKDQTVIDGNLVITGAFNVVKNLTVLGKVIIKGNQHQLADVDYRGGVEDKGVQNKY